MASVWKKVFTSADTIPLANGGTNDTSTATGFVRNSGQAHETVTGTAGQLLVAQGTTTKPAPKSVTGVIAIDQNGATTFNSTAPIATANIQDNAVTFAKLQNLTAGDLIRGLDTGEPGALAVGSNGHVLTVDTGVDGKLKFAAAPSAANVVIGAGGTGEANAQTDALPIIFGNGTGATQDLFGDVTGGSTHFTYEADATFAHKTGTAAATGGAAGVSSSSGFIGNLAGVASGSNLQKVTVGNTSSASSLLLAPNSTTSGQYVTPEADDDLQWDGSKLIVKGALEVQGDVTQTSVNVVNLEVDDVLIKVAGGVANDAAGQSAGPNGVGIAVDNGNAADGNLARFVYKGFSDSASVLGWRIAQAADNTAGSAATAHGVAVMSVTAANTSAASLSGSTDIGVGAMLFSTDGGLFIQTGA